MRLQEAIKKTKRALRCPGAIKELIPENASTIHRLLGSIQGSPYFRFNAENELPVDLVVVDEASMVDLPLMSKLVQSLPPQAQLILLGDKDQLASVEAGAVLGDICDRGRSHAFSPGFAKSIEDITGYRLGESDGEVDGSGLQDSIVLLTRSYRFGAESGIGAVSRAVNQGDAQQAMAILRDEEHGDTTWKNLPEPQRLSYGIKNTVVQGFRNTLKAKTPEEAFEHLESFRVLCALREGPYGVVALNAMIEGALRKQRLIDHGQRWYKGRPVMITINDYNLNLFNGDVGIVFPDSASKMELRAFFPGEDGKMRRLHPVRLPAHETIYAMTVHKCQGSEFDRILLILPDRDTPVLTRELIYTGITRARKEVTIMGREEVFGQAVPKTIERTSGLRDALWEEKP